MCLTRVDKIIDEPTNEVVQAYGVFQVRSGNPPIQSQWFDMYSLVLSQWMKCSHTRTIGGGPSPKYPCGFHKYKAHREPRGPWRHDYICVPVKLRKVRTIGAQDGHRVFVADEMKILKKDVRAALAAWKKRRAAR